MPRFRIRWNTVQLVLSLDRLFEVYPKLDRDALPALLSAVEDMLASLADNDQLFPLVPNGGGRRLYRRPVTREFPTLVFEYAIDEDVVFAIAVSAPNGDDRF